MSGDLKLFLGGLSAEVQAGFLVLKEMATALRAENAEHMLTIRTPGMPSEVVKSSFSAMRANNVMLSNAAFLVIARAWGLESVVGLGMALKVHAETDECACSEIKDASWREVVQQLNAVCQELNGMSGQSVQAAKAQLELELQKGRQELQKGEQKLLQDAIDVRKQAGLAAAEVRKKEAEADVAAARAANAERDLRRKKMGAFKQFATWLVGGS